MLQPFKHNVVWAFLARSSSPVQRFLWKNRIFKALFQQDNDIVQMRDMAHSICLIKLYQITMRKNFDFLFLTTLKGFSLNELGAPKHITLLYTKIIKVKSLQSDWVQSCRLSQNMVNFLANIVIFERNIVMFIV